MGKFQKNDEESYQSPGEQAVHLEVGNEQKQGGIGRTAQAVGHKLSN